MRGFYQDAILPDISDYLLALGELNADYLEAVKRDGFVANTTVGVIIQHNLIELADCIMKLANEEIERNKGMNMTEEEHKLLSLFHALTEEQKTAVLKMVEKWVEENEEKSDEAESIIMPIVESEKKDKTVITIPPMFVHSEPQEIKVIFEKPEKK